MTDTIVFYTNPMSRGRIVHWMLEEIGAPYRTELLSFDKNEHKTPAFLAINPMGKVPTIVHRGVVVTEAAAICTYLADAFPKAGLAPAFDDPARGTYLRWMFFGAGCIEPAIIDRMLERPATLRPDVARLRQLRRDVECAREGSEPGPVRAGRTFQRGRRVSCVADRLGFGHESARSAAGVRAIFGALHRPSGVPAFHRRVADAVLVPLSS